MLTVGVDVGGTRVRAGVVDAEGEIIDTARTSTPRSEEALEAAVAGVVAELAQRQPSARSGWPWPGSSRRTGAVSGSPRTLRGATRPWPTGSRTGWACPSSSSTT